MIVILIVRLSSRYVVVSFFLLSRRKKPLNSLLPKSEVHLLKISAKRTKLAGYLRIVIAIVSIVVKNNANSNSETASRRTLHMISIAFRSIALDLNVCVSCRMILILLCIHWIKHATHASYFVFVRWIRSCFFFSSCCVGCSFAFVLSA